MEFATTELPINELIVIIYWVRTVFFHGGSGGEMFRLSQRPRYKCPGCAERMSKETFTHCSLACNIFILYFASWKWRTKIASHLQLSPHFLPFCASPNVRGFLVNIPRNFWESEHFALSRPIKLRETSLDDLSDFDWWRESEMLRLPLSRSPNSSTKPPKQKN